MSIPILRAALLLHISKRSEVSHDTFPSPLFFFFFFFFFSQKWSTRSQHVARVSSYQGERLVYFYAADDVSDEERSDCCLIRDLNYEPSKAMLSV
jgi:hypothetical protein